MKILFVEDEERIVQFVRKGLTEKGFAVDVRLRGDEGLKAALASEYDAIVLDVMLPGRDGLSILQRLRQLGHNTPVIILSARGELDERLEGLNLGADDYMTKPFFIEELVARLHAVVRRSDGNHSSILSIGDLSVNLLTREVKRGDVAIELTSREFSLLEYLLRSAGRTVTRTQILEHVWEYFFDPKTNVVDVYVRRLRDKLGSKDSPAPIETVRGIGYRVPKD